MLWWINFCNVYKEDLVKFIIMENVCILEMKF